jgi:hypothetical protein
VILTALRWFVIVWIGGGLIGAAMRVPRVVRWADDSTSEMRLEIAKVEEESKVQLGMFGFWLTVGFGLVRNALVYGVVYPFMFRQEKKDT